MTWTELLTDLKQLDRADKLRVMQFLLLEIATDEGALMKSGLTYPVWSPYDSHKAAQEMFALLQTD
ncbi:MAG: hypothetical protein KA314_10110 [Chloroflexi bacterium]|nr:hypothetical protein [Chloroflexota bacterium]MBP8056186.1 hypothetical protein [Chloroflexota bacterium]